VKFSIIHIEPLSGEKAKVYTLKYEEKYVSELQIFADKFNDTHPDLIKSIFQRIQLISKRDGIQESFFRRECRKPNNVFRLMETEDLRIYCIMFSNIILLFGCGNLKKSGTVNNDENPQLQIEIDKLITLENCINRYLDSGELKISCNGFEGNLVALNI
jgi:hypothetical protein